MVPSWSCAARIVGSCVMFDTSIVTKDDPPPIVASTPAEHPVTGWFPGVSISPIACPAWALTGLAKVAVPNRCEVQMAPVELDHCPTEIGSEACAFGVGVLPTVLTSAERTPCSSYWYHWPANSGGAGCTVSANREISAAAASDVGTVDVGTTSSIKTAMAAAATARPAVHRASWRDFLRFLRLGPVGMSLRWLCSTSADMASSRTRGLQEARPLGRRHS